MARALSGFICASARPRGAGIAAFAWPASAGEGRALGVSAVQPRAAPRTGEGSGARASCVGTRCPQPSQRAAAAPRPAALPWHPSALL